MQMQRVDFLNKDNEKDIEIKSLRSRYHKNHESIQTQLEENLDEHEKQSPLVRDRLEFFTSFTCCQAMIFKSWIEAYDKLIKKIQVEKESERSDIPLLYVDIHEEIFSNLFKSTEYASNLGRMINSSMLMMKRWQILAHDRPAPLNKDCLNNDKR